MKHSCFQKRTKSPLLWGVMVVLLFSFSAHGLAAEKMGGVKSADYQQQNRSVAGHIADNTGDPLIGVNVIETGTTNGTITDIDGNFTLTLTTPNPTLTVTYVGFETQTIVVGTRSVINIVMAEESSFLDELIVVGYGTMRRSDLTGAVGMINAQALEREQPGTVQDLLRTGVPGLSVGVATNAKGNVDNILIRGRNNFRGNSQNAPLLVLDGVIYFGQLTDINPNDIERIDVLKDASSTAVFGARAANGVILITTKRGASEKPVVRFSSIIGWNFVNSLAPVYQGNEFIDFRGDVMRAQNPGRPAYYFKDPTKLSGAERTEWLEGADYGGDLDNLRRMWLTRLRFEPTEIRNILDGNVVNWIDLTYQTALTQDYSVSVSGKQGETSYFTSLNHVHNQGNLIGDRFSAVRARLNLETRANRWLSYGIQSQFIARDEGGTALEDTRYRTATPFGRIYNDEGKLTQHLTENSNQPNPFLSRYYTKRENDINVLNVSTFLRAQLPFGFSLQTTYAPRFSWQNIRIHRSTDDPRVNPANTTNTGERQNNKTFLWQLDNLLKWTKQHEKHFFDFTALFNLEQQKTWMDNMQGGNFEPDDALGFHGMGFATVSSITSDDTYRTASALMGRAHYTFDNRYLLTATIRRDGFSAFGSSNPYAVFPSLAAGWSFTEENFFPELEWFNFGRLRLSWGQNGNRDVGIYDALMSMAAQRYFITNPTTGVTSIVNTYYANRMANHNLKWETTTAYNIGLDFAFLGNRLTGSLDMYRSITNDLLMQRRLPNIIGFDNVMSNIGEVQNQGFELSLSSHNIRTRDFTWTTDFAFSYNESRINRLHGLMENIYDATGNIIGQREADDIQNGRFIGRSMDQIWDWKIIGVWQEGEEMDAAAKARNLGPGDFKIWDKNGDGEYTNEDKEFLGLTVPPVRMSMRNSFTFRDFVFSVNMFSYLGHMRSYNRAINTHQLLNVNNRIKNPYWTPENPSNQYSRLGTNQPVSFSIWRRADFVRLENVSIGYQVPRATLANLGVEALNLNLSVRNLHYFSNWPGQDPQTDNNVPRSVQFGLNVTF
ncbi:MAG: SusC/RagA family TonB-linked outer membrane protein [Dysgonamonadaceae bacterium]|nr:SusC/RagA family TonB-linked outer membrane protein [Dysgonamonadaceae bacterium]